MVMTFQEHPATIDRSRDGILRRLVQVLRQRPPTRHPVSGVVQGSHQMTGEGVHLVDHEQNTVPTCKRLLQALIGAPKIESLLGPVFDSYSDFGRRLDSGTRRANKTLQ